MKKITLLLLLIYTFGYTQEIASYSSLSNSACSGSINNDANISVNGICRGSGVNENTGGTYNSNNWTSATSLDPNDYLEWSLTPNSNYQVSLTTLDLRYDRSPSGPSQLEIQIDTGSGFSVIFTDNTVDDLGENNSGIDLSSFTNITNTITFRLYAYNASSTAGTFDIEEYTATNKGIIVNGTVSATCPDNIDFANIQFPNTSQTILQGATSNVVYSQVYEPTLTDTQFSQAAGITAEIGYSTTDTDPSTWTNWLPATYNAGYGGTSNDEYYAEVGSTLLPGTYYIASRFQLNSCNYIYGGTSGVWTSGNSLQLTVLADIVDFNNLQSPATGSINIGDSFSVYARAYEAGVTNDGDFPDDGATGLQVWIGYSTTNTNPDTWTNWVPASFNAQYGNDDEYIADIGSAISTSGTYYYASRFQLNGSSYTYGGISPPSGGNTWDGTTYISGVLNVSNPSSCSSTVTWDGTNWSPSAPDSSTNAILTANYNTNIAGQTSFSACSLTLNSGIELTIAPNTYVEINNDVTNNGRINIQNQGSFVQIEDLATYDDSGSSFTDAAIVDRETAYLDNWYEYTYWSSPVANETFGNALFQSSPYRRFGFNAANFRDSQYETFNDDTLINGAGVDDIDDNGDDWFLKSSGDIMTPGVGYAATHSISAFIFGPNNYIYTFRGILNNGDITVPIERNDAETGDNNWNLIGNPYPSAIDVDLFFAENNLASNPTTGKLTGTIYLWSQNTAPTSIANGNEQLNFSNSDYATINGTMETVGGDGLTPNRYIPSGQGFFVLYDDAAASATGSVIFKNSMRVSSNNDQFFRASSTNNPNKIWLRLTSDIGLNNQIGIGYVNGATSQNDGGFYDAKKTGAVMNSLAFYSVIPGDNDKFVIQGKAPSDLNIDEIIPLGFITNIDVATIYTISIDNLEGDFLTNNTVYLKDNLTSTIHDLTASDYSFTSTVGEFNNRFEIVFNNASLSIDNNEITSNNLSIIELENDNIMFKVGQNFTIQSIQIFDALGKEVYNFKGKNSTETFNMKELSSSLYIAKVTLNNGQTLTKKAIKK